MKTRKLRLAIGFLACVMTSTSFAATLTVDNTVNSFQDNYIVSNGVLKVPQSSYRLLNGDWNWQDNPIEGIFKTATIDISAENTFSFTNFSLNSGTSWSGENNENIKLKMDILTKSKYWVILLTTSLSIVEARLTPQIITASTLDSQDAVRLCSKGLTLASFPSPQKIAIKPFLNRHARYLC